MLIVIYQLVLVLVVDDKEADDELDFDPMSASSSIKMINNRFQLKRNLQKPTNRRKKMKKSLIISQWGKQMAENEITKSHYAFFLLADAVSSCSHEKREEEKKKRAHRHRQYFY